MTRAELLRRLEVIGVVRIYGPGGGALHLADTSALEAALSGEVVVTRRAAGRAPVRARVTAADRRGASPVEGWGESSDG